MLILPSLFQYGVVNTDEDMLYIEPLVNDSYVDKDKLNGTGIPHLIYRHSQLPKYDLGFDNLDLTRIGKSCMVIGWLIGGATTTNWGVGGVDWLEGIISLSNFTDYR
jgi:hypothetical protein